MMANPPKVFWLIPPFCLFTIAFGGTAVPKLNVILSLICRRYVAESNLFPDGSPLPIIGDDSDEQCQIPEVHSRTANFILVMGLIAGILGAFTSPRLGSVSDRYGRNLLMVFSSFGLFATEIVMVLVLKWPDAFPLELLFFGSVLDGLCGSFMLGMALSYSYAADCTEPRHRATAFGAFQGCLFLGIAIGPVLGGLLVEYTGNILSVFYGALVGSDSTELRGEG
jgi:MFS family permease